MESRTYGTDILSAGEAALAAAALAEAPTAKGEPAHWIARRITRWRASYIASGMTWDFIQWGLASRDWQRLAITAHPLGRTDAHGAAHAAAIATGRI